MGKTISEKIEDTQIEIRQLENRKKLLLQEQKVQERKARTKRLCQRAGLFESMVPSSVTLSDEQYRVFLEKVILSEYAMNILNRITTQPEQGVSTIAS